MKKRLLKASFLLIAFLFLPHITKADTSSIPITIDIGTQTPVANYVVSSGVPFPIGAITSTSSLVVVDNNNPTVPVPAQFTPMQNWPDGSIKDVLTSFIPTVDAAGTGYDSYTMIYAGSSYTNPAPTTSISVTDNGTQKVINTGAAIFYINKANFTVLDQVSIGGVNQMSAPGDLVFHDAITGNTFDTAHSQNYALTITEQGPIKTTVLLTGRATSTTGTGFDQFNDADHTLVNVKMWLTFYAGSGQCDIEYTWIDDADGVGRTNNDTWWHGVNGDSSKPYFMELDSNHLDLPLTNVPSTYTVPDSNGNVYTGPVSGTDYILQDARKFDSSSAGTVVSGSFAPFTFTANSFLYGNSIGTGTWLKGTGAPTSGAIASQVSGTPGGIGQYNYTNYSDPVTSTGTYWAGNIMVGSIADNVLTVTQVYDGSSPLAVGTLITGSGIPFGTSGVSILSQTSGTTGGVGTYTLSNPYPANSILASTGQSSLNISSETMSYGTPASSNGYIYEFNYSGVGSQTATSFSGNMDVLKMPNGIVQGYMDVNRGSNGGVTVGIKDFVKNFPNKLSINDQGLLQIFTQPPESDNDDYTLAPGVAKTHNIYINFHTGSDITEPADRFKLFQEHPLLYAGAQWYSQTDVFGPIGVPNSQSASYDSTLYTQYECTNFRIGCSDYYNAFGKRDYGDFIMGNSGSYMWGDNHYEDSHGWLLNYLRLGNKDYFNIAQARGVFDYDIVTMHASWPGAHPGYPAGLLHNHNGGEHETSDWLDTHAVPGGTSELYLLTGDPRALDVVTEQGNWMSTAAFNGWLRVAPELPGDQVGGYEAERAGAWPGYVLIKAYEATGIKAFWNAATVAVNQLVNWWQMPGQAISVFEPPFSYNASTGVTAGSPTVSLAGTGQQVSQNWVNSTVTDNNGLLPANAVVQSVSTANNTFTLNQNAIGSSDGTTSVTFSVQPMLIETGQVRYTTSTGVTAGSPTVSLAGTGQQVSQNWVNSTVTDNNGLLPANAVVQSVSTANNTFTLNQNAIGSSDGTTKVQFVAQPLLLNGNQVSTAQQNPIYYMPLDWRTGNGYFLPTLKSDNVPSSNIEDSGDDTNTWVTQTHVPISWMAAYEESMVIRYLDTLKKMGGSYSTGAISYRGGTSTFSLTTPLLNEMLVQTLKIIVDHNFAGTGTCQPGTETTSTGGVCYQSLFPYISSPIQTGDGPISNTWVYSAIPGATPNFDPVIIWPLLYAAKLTASDLLNPMWAVGNTLSALQNKFNGIAAYTDQLNFSEPETGFAYAMPLWDMPYAFSELAGVKINGGCGSANGSTVNTLTSGDGSLCVAGTNPFSFLCQTNTCTWGCNGSSGGTNTTATACSATVTNAVITPTGPTDGSCGTDNQKILTATPTNLCAVGNASSVSGPTGGIWSWTCSGSNGGQTADCEATQGLPPDPNAFSFNCSQANISLLPLPWHTIAGGGFAISSNACVANDNTHGSTMYNTQVVSPDQYSEVTYDNVGNNNFVFLRYNPATNDMYYVQIGGSSIDFYRQENGVLTLLAPIDTDAWNNGDTFRGQVVGNTLSAYQNGVLVASYTDPSPLTAGGYPGFALWNGASVASWRGDVITAADITPPAAPSGFSVI